MTFYALSPVMMIEPRFVRVSVSVLSEVTHQHALAWCVTSLQQFEGTDGVPTPHLPPIAAAHSPRVLAQSPITRDDGGVVLAVPHQLSVETQGIS
jgi:hypothetical protein